MENGTLTDLLQAIIDPKAITESDFLSSGYWGIVK